MRGLPLLPSLAAVALGLLSLPAQAAPAAEHQCGVRALHLLLRLGGGGAPFDELVAQAPPPPPGGYTMLDLKRLARRFDLGLEGFRLPAEAPVIDRPMLMHLNRDEHGHYVVVRPVGHTGKLVQVLDPSGSVEVLDAEALAASPAWTGHVLAERRSILSPALLLLPAFGLGLLLVLRGGRPRLVPPLPASAGGQGSA
jgi:hypothetical protein